MADTVLPGDVNPGDVITLPDAEGAVVVRAVHLGRGGFILTVAAVDDAFPAEEWTEALTAETRLDLRGRVPL